MSVIFQSAKSGEVPSLVTVALTPDRFCFFDPANFLPPSHGYGRKVIDQVAVLKPGLNTAMPAAI